MRISRIAYASMLVACMVFAIGASADIPENIQKGLDKYYQVFDNVDLLELKYTTLTARIDLSHEEAVKFSEKSQRSQLSMHFEGEELEKQIAMFKKSPGYHESMNYLEDGSVLEQTQIYTFSKNSQKRTNKEIDGSISYETTEDGDGITRYDSFDKKINKVNTPGLKVKDEMIMFQWRTMFYQPQKYSYTSEKTGDNLFRIQGENKEDHSHLVLDVRFQDGYALPVKYTILFDDGSTRSYKYENYTQVDSFPVPSLVVMKYRPKEFSPYFVPLNMFFVLQR